MSEKETQSAILEYLKLKGHVCWRNNTGAFRNPKGGMYWFGIKGSPDIIGLQKETGRFIAIEVKDKGKSPSWDQQSFLDKVARTGGIVVVAYSIEDVIEAGL